MFFSAYSLSALSERIGPLLVAALLLLVVPPAAAQDQAAPSQANAQESDLTVGVQGGRFGVGTASSWPAYGLSGTYHVNEKVTAQAVLGFFGTVSSFSGRGWYRFTRDIKYDLYGYAGAGLYRYDYVFDTENVLGLGAGVGIEASLQKLFDDDDFPPIFANSELGLSYADFDFYNFSALTFGFGIHYRFGSR
jgi:hypothetical protein